LSEENSLTRGRGPGACVDADLPERAQAARRKEINVAVKIIARDGEADVARRARQNIEVSGQARIAYISGDNRAADFVCANGSRECYVHGLRGGHRRRQKQ
jgi:hypothetical protein